MLVLLLNKLVNLLRHSQGRLWPRKKSALNIIEKQGQQLEKLLKEQTEIGKNNSSGTGSTHLDKFMGDQNQDITSWLESFNCYAAFHIWSDERKSAALPLLHSFVQGLIQTKRRDTVQLTQDALAAKQSVIDSWEAPAVAAADMSDPTERHRSSDWSDRSFSGGNMSDILHDVGKSIKKDLKHEMTDAIEKALTKHHGEILCSIVTGGMEEIDFKELGPILER